MVVARMITNILFFVIFIASCSFISGIVEGPDYVLYEASYNVEQYSGTSKVVQIRVTESIISKWEKYCAIATAEITDDLVQQFFICHTVGWNLKRTSLGKHYALTVEGGDVNLVQDFREGDGLYFLTISVFFCRIFITVIAFGSYVYSHLKCFRIC